MKLGLSVVLVALAALGEAQGPQKCTSLRVRRNAASLSAQDWQSISTMLQRMDQDGWLSRFGASHDRLFSRVHGNTCFFPFHRRYVLEFENIARNYDPNFVVPYWDATQSFREPASDPMLTSGILGTNGQQGDNCVTNGIQANMQFTYPNAHCLRRIYNQGTTIGAWYAPEIISSYLQADTTLAKFREDIEYSIHGAVHLGMGGEMNSGYAAQDFSFMIHHANLDRLWWDWQNTHGSFLTYDGPGPGNSPASLSDIIPEDGSVPMGGSSVESVMVLGYGNVCYTYDTSRSPPETYPAGANNAAPSPNAQSAQQQARPEGTSLAAAAADPILSGSSNPQSRALESSRLQNSLGADIMNRFFPGLGSSLFSRKRRSYKEEKPAAPEAPVAAADCDSPQPIPFPPRLNPDWIHMHGFDPERVEMFHKNACDLVELLNNSTYISPY
ncbi:hypothetical protein H4S06_001379 [Coemansia sp. BCRC 34490]|nr:hypothetical protein H4S06_001379 [Coemansia sp. BCRC 34490]